MVIQNVGTDEGSGRCELHYFGAPNTQGREDGILAVNVDDLGPGEVFRSVFHLASDASPREERTCNPGVRSA